MKRLRVGITTNSQISDVASAIWSNGINQNIIFLTMMLQRLANVELVALVNSPATGEPNPLSLHLGVPTVQETDVGSQLDVVIELGMRADQEILSKFRSNGGKLVSYVAGNVLVMNFEALANGVPYGEMVSTAGFDAAWLTPQHWHMNRGYMRMTRSEHTEIAPHIWHPRCFLEASSRANDTPFFRHAPEGGAWRVGVFDPNVNVVKTFHLPFLVCEEAHRVKPEAIERISLFNARQLAGNPHMEEFVQCSSLAQRQKVYVEDRQILAGVLGKSINMVITHQWENNLNYLYWDVLYSGFPLIHNSAPIKHLGYYYPSFQPAEGGKALLDAVANHAERPKSVREEEHAFLWSLSPDNPTVQGIYASLLDGLYAGRA